GPRPSGTTPRSQNEEVMSENTETIETTTEVEPAEQTAVQEATTEVQQTEDTGKTGNEAAKYRRRLRAAEAQRDALTERLETMQRAEVERLAGEHIAKGESLWAAASLADVLDDAGNVDPQRVAAAAQEAQERLGLASPVRTPRPDPSAGS